MTRSSGPATMRAVVCPRYGPPDVIRVEDVERPIPGDGDVLIRVREAVVTRADMAFRAGEPFVARLFTGLRRPNSIPGGEFAGEVVSVGDDVTRFGAGDRVVGSTDTSFGAHAEYVSVPEGGVLATLPDPLSFGDTAGICDGGFTALYFLREKANVRGGQRVLVNGASGAVGTYAVQLARHFGAQVTGVCSTSNLELVESLGADEVLDYTETDFTEREAAYDVVFDAVGKRSFPACKRCLTPGGVYLTTVPSVGNVLWMLRTSVGRGKRAVFAASGLHQNVDDLRFLRGLLESGEIRSVVDRRYPLDDVVEAHRYVEAGHKVGNVVLTMDHDD